MDLEPESMVLSANLEELLQPLREGLAGDWMPPALAEIALLADGEVRVRGAGITLSYRRGFLDHIALPTPRFLEQAEMLCRSHPVSVIQLSDKTPVQVNGGSWWWADSCLDPTEPACLARYVPPVLYHHLVNRTGRDGLPRQGVNPADLTFASREGAWRALSRACVGYGRSLISREGE